MEEVSDVTRASGIEYGYTVNLPESLDEAIEMVPGGAETVNNHLRSRWDQSAKQGPKGTVREAIDAAREAGHDDEEIQQAVNEGAGATDALQAVVDAVATAQESTAGFVLGETRSDGMTKTKAREIGEKAREKLGPDALEEFAREHGLEIED